MDDNEQVKDLVEITFPEKDDFLKIRETLSRIGVASRKDKELFQSCHILHKKGKYYIVHFKELFKLDGKQTNFDEGDVGRRNTIVDLLRQWNLVKVLDSNIRLNFYNLATLDAVSYTHLTLPTICSV